MEGLVLLLLFLSGITLYVVAASIFNGWVLSKLWLWFAVPIFGLKPLTVAQAIGVSMLVGFLTKNTIPETSTNGKKSKAQVVGGFMTPFLTGLVVLGIALIVKHYL